MAIATQSQFSAVAETDPEILPALQAEIHRQQHTIELIASENHVSQAVLEALGSVFTNKYAMTTGLRSTMTIGSSRLRWTTVRLN